MKTIYPKAEGVHPRKISNYKAIFMAFSEPIFITDVEGKVDYINRAAQTFLRSFVRDELDIIVGACLFEVLHHVPLKGIYMDMLKKNRKVTSATFSLRHTSIASLKQYFQMDINKMFIDKNSIMTVIVRNITNLKHADVMRRDFIANVSHELRTPLSSIIGFVETLQDYTMGKKIYPKKFLNIMGEESMRMKRVLDDLLQLSQIEQQEHMIPKGRVDIKKIVQSVSDSLLPIATTKGTRFVLRFCQENTVNGNEDKLTQVIQNLITNALKYGSNKGTVRVETNHCKMRGKDALKVSIADTGEGIAPKHIKRLTERFYRVDKARSKKEGGTGLGLAIVKHIIQNHRGRLHIRSDMGVGSVFSVILVREWS